MTTKERLQKAQEELNRVSAINDTYELLSRWYNNEFCEHRKDENGDYMYDENSVAIFDERGDNPEDLCEYPWYDGERFIRVRGIFRELLKTLETMK